MDKNKTLMALLAATLVISLAGNIYFVLSSGPGSISSPVRESLLYAYHQAFPPLENSTENITPVVNSTLDTDDVPNVNTAGDVNMTVMEMLLQLEEENALNESLVTMLLGIEDDNMSTGGGNMTAEPEPTPDPNAWKSYSSAKWHFSLTYPPSWEVKEGASANPVVTLIAPVETECSAETTECYKYEASLVVSVDQNPATTVLEDYFNQKVSALQKSLGITATSKSAPTTISGNKAYWIEYYTRDNRGNPLKRYMQYFTMLDKKVYILTYSGPYSTSENVYSFNKPDAQVVIDGFVVDRQYRVV